MGSAHLWFVQIKLFPKSWTSEEGGNSSVRRPSRWVRRNIRFQKLPVQFQPELSTAGKTKADVQKLKIFMQRRFPCKQVIPQATVYRPVNEMSSYQQPWQSYSKNEQRAKQKPKFSQNFRHCDKGGHLVREVCSENWNKAQNETPHNEPQETI